MLSVEMDLGGSLDISGYLCHNSSVLHLTINGAVDWVNGVEASGAVAWWRCAILCCGAWHCPPATAPARVLAGQRDTMGISMQLHHTPVHCSMCLPLH